MRILTNSSHCADIREYGGAKARGLYDLANAGLNVPRWAVLGTDVYRDPRTTGQVGDRLAELLDVSTVDNLAAVSARIADLFADLPLPAEVIELAEQAYHHVGAARVAVRSSGEEEDGSEFSFAGQFATFLNVANVSELCERLKSCWASVFSERALRYRLGHGLTPHGAACAVIVQEMVDSDRSGVLFTADPTTGGRDEYVISSVYGLGEGLVSGAVDADTIALEATSGAVLRTVVGEKRERFAASTTGSGCTVVPVPSSERALLSLSDKDIARLREAGARITEAFEAPQDIEWAIADDSVWILQSRPITTRQPAHGEAVVAERVSDGEFRVWDNANIIESFSGITSPLTFSFAADVYARIYWHYAKDLRVPAAQLRQMDDWLPHLLGHFHGRVYYNLLHWYRMVRLAPIYPLNRKVLEASLGVDEPLADEVAESLYPYTFSSPLRRRWSRTVTTVTFTKRFLSMNRLVRQFIRYFYGAYREFDNVDYDALPGSEVYRRFRSLERELIAKWGPMMALDASLLISFGALHLLTKRWLPDAPEWFTPAVANPGPDVESAEPARALLELAATVRADPELTRLLTATSPADVREALAGNDFLAAIDDYTERYGYRSADELKLEVPDLREDPTSLFTMLRGALAEPPATSTDEAEAYLREHLRGPRRWAYEVVRRKTRSGLLNRERLRFCRTRAFGSAKRMLRAMGRDLARAGVIEDWDDVFVLRLAEVRAVFENPATTPDLRKLVAVRKRQRLADEQLRAPSRFETTGSDYAPDILAHAGWATGDARRTGVRDLRGTPSCPGVAEGPAVVTDSPLNADGGILVTYRTDPGWVTALPSAAALVIERGSPLTHVAIVARELGIPTVVQVSGVTTEIRTGMRVRVDGGAGTITVLDEGKASAG